MSESLSVATNVLANAVELNLDSNQKQLRNSVTQLSSGLRINTAADDPSGLAISTDLQTQVDGFNQASSNVQNANNAAQVALGALTTTNDILQRIRGLAVEAASDISSTSDRANLQAEISQLLLEINRISQNTNFNGQTLLDGSHAGFQAEQNAFLTITANSALAQSGNGKLANVAVNGNFAIPAQPVNSSGPAPGAIPGWTLNFMGITDGAPGFFPPLPAGQQSIFFRGGGSNAIQTITGLVPNTSYALTFEAGAPGVDQFQANANGASLIVHPPVNSYQTFTLNFTTTAAGAATITFNNPTWFANIANVQVVPTFGGAVSGINTGFLIASAIAASAQFNTTVGSQGYSTVGAPYATVDGTIELQVINTGVSIAAQETFINSATGQVSISANLLSPLGISDNFDNVLIATGDFATVDVGTTAFIKISQNVAALTNPGNPALNIQSAASEGDTLQIGIEATNSNTLRVSNINVATSAGNAPSLAAEDAIGQVDNALTRVLTQEAQLGAVVVRLNEDQNNDNVAAINLQGAESSIRDLNAGKATSEFTKLQILVQVGTSILAQSNLNAQSVLPLFR